MRWGIDRDTDQSSSRPDDSPTTIRGEEAAEKRSQSADNRLQKETTIVVLFWRAPNSSIQPVSPPREPNPQTQPRHNVRA
jgi:hypothetical protein